MKETKIILFILSILFASCGEPSNYHYVKENEENDIESAKNIATEFYTKLLTKDSLKIRSCFDSSIYSDIDEFIEMLIERENNWGKFHSFSIGEIHTKIVHSNKGDTVSYWVEVNAVYDDNQSWDDITFRRTKNGRMKIVDYDFSADQMLNCGSDELSFLLPIYQDYSNAIFLKDTAKIMELCGGDEKFYADVLYLQNEYFPPGTTLDSLAFNDGHIRKYCGQKGEANGILIFTVYYNDTVYLDIIYKIEKNYEEDEYNMYSIYLTGELKVDAAADIELSKSISREIYKIIQKNNSDAFIQTFHTNLRDLYTKKTLEEVKFIVEDFKKLGTFVDYYSCKTFRTNDKEFIYFIVVLELKDDDDAHNYLELVFKPDTNGKFMLMSIHEMLD